MQGTDEAEREQQALDLVQLSDEADAAGQPWLSRMARAACGLAGDPVLVADAVAVADECERRGDRWGSALAWSVTILHDWRHGRLNHAMAAQLVARCRELDAGVLQVWAQVFVGLTAAADGLPEAEMEVRAAANLAASAGVPGAHAAATAALARLYPARRPQLVAEAGLQAAAAGVPARAVLVWAGHTEAPAAHETAPAPVAVAVANPSREALRISITSFGGFRLEIDDRVVDLTEVRARARSALRLLAMQAGQMVHREKLIEALWPGLTPAAATRNLQVTISALRGLLDRACGPGGPALLVRSDSAYGLELPPGGYCDTVAFQAAVARWRRVRGGPDRAAEVGALREALGAYGGDLFPEEGPAEWAVAAREHFRFQVTEISRALAAAELDRGEVTEAIAAAEHCLTLDPFDDAAWQVLLTAYERAGAPAKAAEARRRYTEMLAGLGLDDLVQVDVTPAPPPVPAVPAMAGRTAQAPRGRPGARAPRRTRI
jgi:DNA-binding SARP family transcriptional activator